MKHYTLGSPHYIPNIVMHSVGLFHSNNGLAEDLPFGLDRGLLLFSHVIPLYLQTLISVMAIYFNMLAASSNASPSSKNQQDDSGQRMQRQRHDMGEL